MSKYDPLLRHLSVQTLSLWRASFSDVEDVLGFPLPNSARNYPAWWSNGSGMPQSDAWLKAGWRTEELDLGSGRISFRRISAGISPQNAMPIPHVNLTMAAIEELKIAPVDVRVGFAWVSLGSVALDPQDRLVFPAVPNAPGLYSFQIVGGGRTSVYIGEAERLARRFAHYRNPGPSQATNVRINQLMRQALKSGMRVAVSAAMSGAWVERDGVRKPVDFSSKAVRCLAENAALLSTGGRDVETLNHAGVLTGVEAVGF